MSTSYLPLLGWVKCKLMRLLFVNFKVKVRSFMKVQNVQQLECVESCDGQRFDVCSSHVIVLFSLSLNMAATFTGSG